MIRYNTPLGGIYIRGFELKQAGVKLRKPTDSAYGRGIRTVRDLRGMLLDDFIILYVADGNANDLELLDKEASDLLPMNTYYKRK